MSLNSFTLNTYPLNGEPISGSSANTGSGVLIYIEQNVVLEGSGVLISLEQVVELGHAGSGLLITLEQETYAIGSGVLISLEQVVLNQHQSTFLERNGWYPILTIDNQVIPDNQIHGQIRIGRVENSASQMSFTLIPPKGTQDLYIYEGKKVTLDITMKSGEIRRIYTGYINVPDVDIINKKTYYTCSDLRTEKINSSFGPNLPYIGYYDSNVFGTANDVLGELNSRLTTTTKEVDLDSYGNIFVSDLFAKPTPDYTFNSSQIYRDAGRDPKVTLATRSLLVNREIVSVNYSFPRLYQREILFQWQADWPGDFCGFLINGYSLVQRSTIQSAIQAAGWPYRDLNFTELPPNGTYNCLFPGQGIGPIGWSTITVSNIKSDTVRDASGNTVNDANGNPLTRSSGGTFTDSRDLLAQGAGWRASTRFAQTVTEKYTFVIEAPQSIARYGYVDQSEAVSIQAPDTSNNWENYPSYKAPPPGYIYQSGSDWVYEGNDRSQMNNVYYLMTQRAVANIRKAHRSNTVEFNTSINPFLELYHTVQIDGETSTGSQIVAKGKVGEIEHTIDFSTPSANTRVVIYLSKTSGTASNSSFSVPTPPIYQPAPTTTAIRLSSRYLTDPGPGFNGFVGNGYTTKIYYQGTKRIEEVYRTNIQERFTVTVPPIEDAVRANKELPVNIGYTIALQDDLLEVAY